MWSTKITLGEKIFQKKKSMNTVLLFIYFELATCIVQI